MTLYESNYIRLGWLVGNLRALDGEHRSRVDGDVELKLSVLERGPYTTTLSLTYVFGVEDSASSTEDPDLEIRVYHDARLAEARTDVARPSHPGLRQLSERARREAAGSALGERWARNMMLNKWLEYCADRGHRFGAHST